MLQLLNHTKSNASLARDFSEVSLQFCENIGVGCDLGGVINHTKASMLHLLKDQRDLLAEGP